MGTSISNSVISENKNLDARTSQINQTSSQINRRSSSNSKTFRSSNQIFDDNTNHLLQSAFNFGTKIHKSKNTEKALRFVDKNGGVLLGLKGYQGYAEIADKDTKKILFQGEFKNGMREGFGIEYHPTDSTIIYEGEFLNDEYHGWGKAGCYEGQFQKGVQTGWGVENDESLLYIGDWKDNFFHGDGALNVTIQKIKQFMKDRKRKDMGQFKQNFKEIYVGQWNKSKKQGYGKYEHLNDDKPKIGYFSDNKFIESAPKKKQSESSLKKY